MKKALLAALGIALLAYPAASWYLGIRVESVLDDHYRQLESMAYVTVSERHYERGVFGATESVTLEIFGELMKGLGGGASPRTPLLLTLRSRIRHGPFAGGSLAVAAMHSELRLDPEVQAEVDRLTGGASLLSGRAVFQLDGSGTGRLSSPAFSTERPDPETGETLRLVWGGIRSEVAFAAQMQHYSMSGSLPRLEMTNDEGVGMVMLGMRFSADQQRLLADDPLLYAGPQHFAVEQIRIVAEGDAELALERLRYDVDTPTRGDFVDLIARTRVEAIETEGRVYGPASCDFSIRHLHARTLAGLYRRLLDVYADPPQTDGGGDAHADAYANGDTDTADTLQPLALVAEPALELLGHQPTVHLDRLSVATAEGELLLEAHASLPGIQPGAFGNPALLLAGLDARARIAVPKALLIRLATERAGTQLAAMSDTGVLTETDIQTLAAQLEVKLAQLIDQGLIQRDGDALISEITLEAGQLRVNGEPFDPNAIQ